MNAPIDATLQNLYDWIERKTTERQEALFWGNKDYFIREEIASVDRDGLALTTPEE